MESPFSQEIYLEGKQEGLQQGIQQGKRIALRSAIMEILANRFHLTYRVGKPIEEKLDKIEDVSLLRCLLVEAATVASPEEFAAQLHVQ